MVVVLLGLHSVAPQLTNIYLNTRRVNMSIVNGVHCVCVLDFLGIVCRPLCLVLVKINIIQYKLVLTSIF